MIAKHPWILKSRFRSKAYGWKGSSFAIKRLKEAVSEIKKVARIDAVTAAGGAVSLFERFWPALELLIHLQPCARHRFLSGKFHELARSSVRHHRDNIDVSGRALQSVCLDHGKSTHATQGCLLRKLAVEILQKREPRLNGRAWMF